MDIRFYLFFQIKSMGNLTHFGRKCHLRHTSRNVISNSVDVKKTWKGHIPKAWGKPFLMVDSNCSMPSLFIKKLRLKKKIEFSGLFFSNPIIETFHIANRPGTFLTGGMNVWTLRICGSEFNCSPYYFQSLNHRIIPNNSRSFYSKVINVSAKYRDVKRS